MLLKSIIRVHRRLFVFALIGIFTAGIGFLLNHAADSGSESKNFAADPPLALDFYVNNPSISLKIQVFIYPKNNKSSEELYVQADVPSGQNGDILILSNKRDRDGQFHRLSMAADMLLLSGVGSEYNDYFSTVVPVPGTIATEPDNNFSINIDFFSTGSVIQNTKASSYGHLPSIDALYNAIPFQDVDPCIIGNESRSGSLNDVSIDPEGTICFEDPKKPLKNQYYPASVQAAEILDGAASMLKTEQTDYINPSGNATGDGYIWQSSSSIEPIFEVTDQDVAEKQDEYNFASGVFLGLAGAAIIAALQELPMVKHKQKRIVLTPPN